MNKQTFYKVSEDMPMSLLDQLRQEGRLYYVSSSDELVQKAVSSALKQIRKIDGLSNEPYRKVVAEIWEEILDIRRVRERLLFKKGKQQGKVNWYYVCVIVNCLYVRGVYMGRFRDLLGMLFNDISIEKSIHNRYYMLSEEEENAIKAVLQRFFQ
jgi:hypothetical protein